MNVVDSKKILGLLRIIDDFINIIGIDIDAGQALSEIKPLLEKIEEVCNA